MFKASLALIFLLLIPATALAGGTVTKILRPQVHLYDDKGQPAGTASAGDIRVPTPIVGTGMGGSIGIKYAGKVVYLRGLDVQTEGVNAACQSVQVAARASGSAYAGTNAGLGGACEKR